MISFYPINYLKICLKLGNKTMQANLYAEYSCNTTTNIINALSMKSYTCVFENFKEKFCIVYFFNVISSVEKWLYIGIGVCWIFIFVCMQCIGVEQSNKRNKF